MKLYHGSEDIIERPEYGKGNVRNDYGLGFYCTENRELAREWSASDKRRWGFSNAYDFDDQSLKTLLLDEEPYTALHWLSVLLQNRIFDESTEIARLGKQYLIEVFDPKVSEYDVVIGWRADDSYFSFARAFLRNEISYEQLTRSMRLGGLGQQVVLKSPEAFERIEFLNAEQIECSLYYPRRLARDQEARAAYRAEARRRGITGLYMRDILAEEVQPDDLRLR